MQAGMDKLDRLAVVLVSDERFAMPMAVTISSLLRRLVNRHEVDLYVLDGGVTSWSRRRVEKVVQISRSPETEVEMHWVTFRPEWLPGIENYEFRNSNFNQCNFFRYAIPQILPESIHHAVFIDSDVIVEANVAELTAPLTEDASVAAVRDYSIPTMGKRFPKGPPDWLSCRPDEKYFNSGVLGINVDYWRRHDVTERALSIVRADPQTCRWPGQDPMNFALRGTWREVDLGWNLQTGGPDRIARLGGSQTDFLGEPYEQIRQRAKIIHFTGNKPWEQGFTNPDRPAWVEALRESGWFSSVGFRRWQAGWWAKLIKRQAGKRWEHYRQRLTRRRPAGATPVEQS